MNYFSPDYSKRDYLLPKGCKDLIDVLRLEEEKEQISMPAEKGDLTIADPITVLQLATLLNETPFTIIAELMELGIFASSNQMIDFSVAAKVVRKHGYRARRAL